MKTVDFSETIAVSDLIVSRKRHLIEYIKICDHFLTLAQGRVRWPPRPYMVKTFENLLLQNRMSYDLETWHVALGTQALQSLYKWWLWVDLDLFYRKVKFGNLGFSIGKSENSGFSETIAANDLKIGSSRHQNECMKLYEYWRSRSFLDLGPRLCIYKNLKPIFSKSTVPI